MDKATYKELFILTIVNACRDLSIASSEYEAHIESNGNDIDYSSPEEDAKDCLSYWSE